MTGEEALARIRSKLQQTAEETPAAKALIEKIRSGKATYADTSLYARWAAINLGMSLSDVICDIDLSDRAAVCKALLLDQYEDINGFIDMVQAELDSRFGIQLAPHRAPFNDERADTIGHSLADTTRPDEVIRRRARSATETAVKSMHDDRMKSEAKFRHSAGLDCRIIRVAVNGCCPWCSDVAGRYRYGEEPDDIYKRHDNCDCTVTFENGRKRQDVWSKREWEAPKEDAGAGERVVLTEEQAEILALRHRTRTKTDQKSIDFFAKGGILKGEYDERDIIRAITQNSTNFVTRDINDPESVFGELVESIMPDPKYYDIKAHGSPTAVKLFGSVVDAQTLARVIVLREDYTGKPIRLLCCETGKEEGAETCFAQQLADLLGVEVLAPTETFYASITGRIKVESEETGRKGEMKTFTPNKKGGRE